jgi:iron complex transport system substrate-binding protein
MRGSWPLSLLLACAAAACGEARNPPELARATGAEGAPIVVDDAGASHAGAPPRSRVLSLIPGVTDVVLALGAGESLVGRTRFDVQPEIAGLPSVGGGLDPSVESIVTLRPDLVIAWPDGDLRSIVGRLEDAEIPVYQANYRTRADVVRHMRNLGRLLGRGARADSLLNRMAAASSDLAASLAGVDRPSVLYIVALDPLMTTGPDTFLGSLIEEAGARNVFDDLSSDWPQVSLEEVVRRAPDYVILPHAGNSGTPRLDERPAWSSLAAVRDDRVILVDADLFSRPGPNLVVAARTLAARLHPDRVSEPP